MVRNSRHVQEVYMVAHGGPYLVEQAFRFHHTTFRQKYCYFIIFLKVSVGIYK